MSPRPQPCAQMSFLLMWPYYTQVRVQVDEPLARVEHTIGHCLRLLFFCPGSSFGPTRLLGPARERALLVSSRPLPRAARCPHATQPRPLPLLRRAPSSSSFPFVPDRRQACRRRQTFTRSAVLPCFLTAMLQTYGYASKPDAFPHSTQADPGTAVKLLTWNPDTLLSWGTSQTRFPHLHRPIREQMCHYSRGIPIPC